MPILSVRRRVTCDEVDEAGQCFRLEDSKEGASIRPIGRQVIDLLRSVDRKTGSPFVLRAAQ